MESSLKTRDRQRKKRAIRGRRKLKKRFRLSVHKTNRHLFAQIIDVHTGTVVGAGGTAAKESAKKSKKTAFSIGAKLAGIAKEKLTNEQLQEIVFDRGRWIYHGLVASIADGARDAGLRI